MRRGFDGRLYVNTGTAAAPEWSLVDCVDDVEILDDSEQLDSSIRDGESTKARGLLSVKLSFAVDSSANETGVVETLLVASRDRDGFADFFLADTDAAAGAAGVRLLGLVTQTDSQPAGGRWLRKFEAVPCRASGDWLDEGVAPLASYTVPGEADNTIDTETGDPLETEAGAEILLEI